MLSPLVEKKDISSRYASSSFSVEFIFGSFLIIKLLFLKIYMRVTDEA